MGVAARVCVRVCACACVCITIRCHKLIRKSYHYMRFARFRFCRSKSRKGNPADQQVPAGGKDKFGSTSETGQDECKGKVRCQATPSEPVTAVRCTSGSVSGAPSAEKVSFRIAKMFSSLKN